MEASFTGDAGDQRLNLRSCGRALLLLLLFSDVGPDDAPTRILADAGEAGRGWFELCREAVRVSAGRPEVAATGTTGDVLLCHPFLVHAGQRHRGRVPRFMAQPPLLPTGLLDLSGTSPTPVERAVLIGLGSRQSGR